MRLLASAPGSPGVIPAAARVGCSRRRASGVPDEWPSRRGNPPDRTRLIGRLTPERLAHRILRSLAKRAQRARPSAWPEAWPPARLGGRAERAPLLKDHAPFMRKLPARRCRNFAVRAWLSWRTGGWSCPTISQPRSLSGSSRFTAWRTSFAVRPGAASRSTDKRRRSTWPRRAATWKKRSNPHAAWSPPMAHKRPPARRANSKGSRPPPQRK